MKLAAKQAELAACPYVSEESKAQLEAAAQPPIRLITLSGDGTKVEAGNETVMFRHEKTFYHAPGLFVRVKDTQSLGEIEATAAQVSGYTVEYVGLKLTMAGLAVEAASGDAGKFAAAVEAVRGKCKLPLILIGRDPAVLEAGLAKATGIVPLIYGADGDNAAAMAELAKKHKAPLAIRGNGDLNALADLAEQVKAAGVADIVLDPGAREHGSALVLSTQIRRLALKKNFRPLGYPLIAFPGEGASSPDEEVMLAAQHIAKYAGFVVLDHFDPATVYPLLVLRQNIFTDPQKPIQVKPGLYEINNPGAEDPVLTTTNFSITYFSVANEVEGSGLPAWLLIVDAEGMSVLTGWAAGKFDSDRITKAVSTTGVAEKSKVKQLVIPGLVAVLLGELEEALPDWKVMVGPREAVDIPGFMKVMK